MTSTKQANFSLPEDLLAELRRQVPKGDQSRIVAEALRKELLRMRFRRALDSAFGSWKSEDHPELKQGTEKYIRRFRHSSRLTAQDS
jgi:hypothetical protein